MAIPAAACSSDDSPEQATGSDRSVTVTMTDNAYAPASIPAAAGETVTFRFVNDGLPPARPLGVGHEGDRHRHLIPIVGAGLRARPTEGLSERHGRRSPSRSPG